MNKELAEKILALKIKIAELEEEARKEKDFFGYVSFNELVSSAEMYMKGYRDGKN